MRRKSKLLPDSFEEAVSSALGSWPPKTRFLAAVSGGGDSAAMLCALGAIRSSMGIVLRCLHVDHGIRSREECRLDAESVQVLGRSLGIPVKIVRIPPGTIGAMAKSLGIGVEAAARTVRHDALRREAARIGAARVLVAHTRDDLLETLLMRILRGAGPEGLRAMPRERAHILRPLLGLDRADALAYLAARGIAHREDASNQDLAYLRNRIRHRLIPLLDEWFPSWKASLLALAETQGLAADFLHAEAERRLPWRREKAGLSVDRELFFSQSEIIREEALFLGIDQLAASATDEPPRRGAVRAFSRQRGAGDLGAARAELRQGRIVLRRREEERGEAGFSLLIKEPGTFKIMKLRLAITAIQEDLPASSDDSKEYSEDSKEQAGDCCEMLPLAGIRQRFFADLPLALRYTRRERRGGAAGKGAKFWSDALRKGQLSGTQGVIVAEDPLGIAAYIGIRSGKPVLLSSRSEAGGGSFVVSLDTTYRNIGDKRVNSPGGLYGTGQ